MVPVISCIGATEEGEPLNINGDTVASEIALAVDAESLLLVTDMPGIRIERKYQKEVTPNTFIGGLKKAKFTGGMIPKVRAIRCLKAGIPKVEIVGEQLKGTIIIRGGSYECTYLILCKTSD